MADLSVITYDEPETFEISLRRSPRVFGVEPPRRKSQHGGLTLSLRNEPSGDIRSIGIARAKAKIGLQNLAYNISRLVTLERMAAAWGRSVPARPMRAPGAPTLHTHDK
jgi:hypothetical protein